MAASPASSRRSHHPLIERALASSRDASRTTRPGPTTVPVPPPISAPLPPGNSTGGTPIDADVRFLVHRATMGFSVPAYQEALSMGYDAWLEWQLDWENVDDSAAQSTLDGYQALELDNPELLERFPDPLPLTSTLQQARLVRAMFSRRQLYERMVEFWTDHFNINLFDELCQWFKLTDDREVIRPHALGKFPDLLRASAHSPAMMWYLDNYANVAGAEQENYARELQELHTLGVDGPYTELDVTEVARCFTGWGVHGVGSTQGRPGNFHFDASVHDTGSKTVLGHFIPAGGGKSDGDFVLELLANHPSTADFLSRKMARWLLSYDPPEHVIQGVVQVFHSTGGDIKAMVRRLLQPEVVVRVPKRERPKAKRPLELVTSLMRAVAVESQNPFYLGEELDEMGQEPFAWRTPDGYPDDAAAWASTILPRWRFVSKLMARDVFSNLPEVTTIEALLATAPAGSSRAQAIDWVLTGGLLGDEAVAAVQRLIESQPDNGVVLREAIAFAASTPAYQYL